VSPVLEAVGLRKQFGGLTVTNDVSLSLAVGERRALIGPNGAGKTTLINLLTGNLRPNAGNIRLGGEEIGHLAPDRRVRRGLVRTFQINQLFPAMTPLEAIGVAIARRNGIDWNPWHRAGRAAAMTEESVALLERFGLADVMTERTGVLAYGKQRLLEIALAVACGPRVLLLDEPAAGVPEDERAEILAGIAKLPPEVALLLIEHDMDMVFRFAERISVLVAGAVLTEGTVEEVASDPRVREVYLGEASHG
jgi:branched-chain amino acid transport system ATP-binding protein